MLRLTILVLPLGFLIFNSCKRGDTQGEPLPKEFTINDVHDVAVGGDTASYLEFNVANSSGNTEEVAVSIADLPDGIEAAADLAGGTRFTAYHIVNFTQTGIVEAGTYPIRIVGMSESYSASAALSLIILPLNGWSVDNKIYRKFQIERGELLNAHLLTVTTNDGLATISFLKTGQWPVADGTYTYSIGGPDASSGTVFIEFSDGRQNNGATFSSDTTNNGVLTLLMHGGKASLNMPETFISDGSTSKSITVSTHE